MGVGQIVAIASAVAGGKASKLPEGKNTTASDVDLDITDERGNVLARFTGGHIITKRFDSSNIINPVRTRIKFAAHNGAYYLAPECTIPAYRIAGQLGYEEADVAGIDFSTDGTMYVIHDDTVDRTTDGKGYLHDKTDAEIAALNITKTGEGYDLADFDPAELKIPTLEQVIQQCVCYDMKMVLRLHAFPNTYDTPENIAVWDALVNLLKVYNVKTEDIICYVGTAAMANTCRTLFGNDVTIATFLGQAATAQSFIDWFTNGSITGNRAAIIHYINLDLSAVKLLHSNGIQVYCYGSQSEEEAANCAVWGVDVFQNSKIHMVTDRYL